MVPSAATREAISSVARAWRWWTAPIAFSKPESLRQSGKSRPETTTCGVYTKRAPERLPSASWRPV